MASSAGHLVAQPVRSSQLNSSFWVRFVQVVAFLFLMDPNRGDPTENTFDQHPLAGEGKRNHKKRKFLDSLALVAAGDGNGTETATAVCWEQRPLGEGIFRLARNTGITEDRVSLLQGIITNLQSVAKGDAAPVDVEAKLTSQVAQLCEYKIRNILGKLHKKGAQADINHAALEFELYTRESEDSDDHKFHQCVSGLRTLINLPLSTASIDLLHHLHWASRARWRHSEQIKQLFGQFATGLDQWLPILYKLGRYYTVVQNMMSLAKTQPDELLPSLRVEAVKAPKKESLKANEDKNGLVTIVLRLTAKDFNKVKPEEREHAKGIIKELGKSWLTNDPKTAFNNHCSQVYIRHCEMQLLDYYDHNYPDETPGFLFSFMGTSKKTCYLCDLFLEKHRLRLKASGSHKKLWPAWKPMSEEGAVKGNLRKENRENMREICTYLERVAKADMEERLRTTKYARKKSIMDSSAGPSLPTSSGGIASMMGVLSIGGTEGTPSARG